MSQPGDTFARGFEYLQMVQSFALEPGMVDLMGNWRDSIPIYNWIGKNIDIINAELNTHLQTCHEYFHPGDRRHIQIFAAPLARSFGIDAMCNIRADPITILVDVGQVEITDWLGIVVHEYAHAHIATSGHNEQFASVLCHLCLGLDLEPPTWEVGTMEASLRSWPNCKSTINPLGFWMGETSYNS